MRTVFQRKDTTYVPDVVKQQNLSQMICVQIVNAKKVMIKGEKIMKKTLSLLLAMILVFLCLTLASCGSGSESSKSIKLTLENYEDYLSIDSAKVYGTGSPYWSSYLSAYQYPYAEGNVLISGVYNYEYDDVVINITIHIHYGKDYKEIPISVKLNKGGSGKGSRDVYVVENNGQIS